MQEPLMRKAWGDRIELQTAIFGATGQPVVCIHGLTANLQCYRWMAESLASDHQVVAFDLRGRGLSDKPETGYAISYHIRDIAALLDRLGFFRVALVGHSLGAAIALNFATEHPERVSHLVLVDGAGKLTLKQTVGVLNSIKPSLNRLGRVFESREEYLKTMKMAPFITHWNPILDLFYRYEMEDVETGVRCRISNASIKEELANLAAFDPIPLYSQVVCPTMIVRASVGMSGQDDILLPKNALAVMVENIDRVWVTNLSNANHYSVLFNENIIRDRAIANFLET